MSFIENFVKVAEIVDLIAKTSSTNAKLQILKDNSDNELLEKIFILAYDKSRNYYITSTVFDEFISDKVLNLSENDYLIHANLNIFDSLSNRVVTGHSAFNEFFYFQQAFRSLGGEPAVKLLRNILDRDLRCGVSVRLASQVFSGLSQPYPIMLAMKDEEKNRKKFSKKFPLIAQIKSDGARVNLHVDVEAGTVEAYSRNGKSVDCINEKIKKDAFDLYHNSFVLDKNFIVDGELLVESSGDTDNRQTGNGIVNKAIRGTISDEERNSFYVSAWDIIPFEVFSGDNTKNLPYRERFSQLNFWNGLGIRVIESRNVTNWDEVVSYYQEAVSKGLEGLIIKDPFAKWEPKRSSGQMKMKEEIEADVIISEFEEGKGKFVGTLGALKVETADGKVSSDVGSGFDDKTRNDLWERRFEILGKICKIKYNGLTVDKKTGEVSFYLPIFVEMREDKNEADTIKV